VFIALAIVAALTLVAAIVYWRYHEEALPEAAATGAAEGAS
jgi:hypothetical protein